MKNIPEIRIKGFEGEWKSCTFDEEIERISIMSNDKHLPKVEYEDINSGKGTLNKDVRRKKSNKVGLLFQPDDILFGKLRPYLKNILKASFEGIAVGDFWIYRPKGDSNFLYYLMQTNQYSEATSQTTGTKMPRADWNVVSKSEFNFPNLAEQQSLGSFFSSFDRLLSDHHRRLENLRRVKKSMLQKMFPQQGQTVPEIRFKGFSGEWEKLLLGDLLDDNIKTNTFSRALLSDGNGEVLDIHYGDILIKFDSVLNVADVKIPHITGSKAKDFNCYLQDGDIIFADTAEDETAGKCIEIENIGNKYLVSGLHTIACRPNKVIGKGFLGYYLNSPNYHNQLLPLMQGIKVFSINKMPLKQTFVQLPSSVDEQRRIGSFFTSLDNLINDEVNYIDQLTRVKSTLLQKMFV